MYPFFSVYIHLYIVIHQRVVNEEWSKNDSTLCYSYRNKNTQSPYALAQ